MPDLAPTSKRWKITVHFKNEKSVVWHNTSEDLKQRITNAMVAKKAFINDYIVIPYKNVNYVTFNEVKSEA